MQSIYPGANDFARHASAKRHARVFLADSINSLSMTFVHPFIRGGVHRYVVVRHTLV